MPSKMKPARLSRAVSAVIDSLENRCLFAALVPSSSVLVFNSDVNAGPAHTSHTDTLTITNSGSTALNLSGASIVADPNDSAGDQSADFLITSTLPATLAAGASTNITVNFTASVANTIESALLQINSSDPGNPVTSVQLNGLGTNGQYGYNEPSLANILTAFEIPTNIGVTDPSNSQYPQSPSASSQEQAIQRLVKAGAGPVTIQMLASFDTNSSPSVRFGYYTPGDTTSTNKLFTINSLDAQTVNPVAQGVTSFDPGSNSFGLYATFPGTSTSNGSVDTHYSEDALNTLSTDGERKFRFFPLEDAQGNVVANSYVVAAEDYDASTYNSFTNFVAIISNVTAAPGAPSGPVLGLTNQDFVPGSNTLVFNRIQNINPDDPAGFVDTVHDENTLQVTNTGDQTLNISLSLSDYGEWQIVSPTSSTASIAPGGTLNVTVKFIAQGNPPHTDNQTNDTTPSNPEQYGLTSVQSGGVWNGQLIISSNDAANPTKTVNLAGYWQFESEHEMEPSLQTIVNNMFGFGTEIASSQMPDYLNANGGTTRQLYGDEIYSPYWNVADSSEPVTLYQLVAYHTQYDPGSQTYPAAAVGYYPQGNSASYSVLFQDVSGESQSVLPIANSGSTTPAQKSFNPSGTFGWLLDGEMSDDALNTTDMSDGRSGHSVRIYPAIDSAGNVIPNTYLIALDYQDSSFDNSDYQDLIYLATNVTPANAAPAPTSLQGYAGSSGVTLQWSPVSDASQGYDIYRSTSANGSFTEIASGYSGTSYLDGSAPQGSTLYYQVRPVNSNGESVGAGTTVVPPPPPTPPAPPDVLTSTDINTTPAGSTTIVTSGSAYTLTGGAGDIGGTAADGFRFAYEQVAGDFDVSVQVASVTQSVAGNSKAGIMARASIDDPGSEMVFAGVTPTQGYRFNYRTVADTVGTYNSVGSITYPNAWVRLTRTGNVFTTYESSDGVTWTAMGSITLALPTTLYLGLAADSHTGGTTLTAQFQNLSLTQSSQSNPPPAPTGLTATADQNGTTLTWAAAAGAAGYNVYRSASASGPFTKINSSPITTTSYVDAAAPVDSTSYYEVFSVDGAGTSSATAATTSALRPATSTTLSFGGRTVATYTDDAGHKVTLRLSGPGTGVATFNDGAATPDSITLTNTTAGTTFTIQVVGGTTHVGTITATGSLATVAAPTTVLEGDLAVTGSLGTVRLAGASGGHMLSVGAGRRVATLNLGQVTDLSIDSAVAIGQIVASVWSNTAGTDVITAPSITTLSVQQGFGAGLTLNGSGRDLGTARVRGVLSGGPWTITGSAGSVVAGSVDSTWSGAVASSLTSFNARGDFAGALAAGTIGTLHVGGNLTGTVSLTGGTAHDLRVLSVLGAIDGGQVRAAGSIGSVTAGALVNANVFAGVSGAVTALPTTLADFTNSASITSVTVNGRRQPFAVQGSNVAAMTLGRVNFGAVNTDNGGTPFGIAAHALTSYTRRINGQVLTWTNRKSPSLLTSSGDAEALLL